MEELRKAKEAQKFEEKQQTRQKLIEKQAAHLASIRNREEEILEKQVNEAEEKATRLFLEKERRRLEQLEMIEQSRKNQISKRT
jgi:hypothetical protein